MDIASNVAPLAAYVAKLERRQALPADERQALLSLPATVRHVDSRCMIVEEGQPATSSIFLIDGLVSRQLHAQQIVALGFEGDAVDLQTLFFSRADHSLYAHTPTVFASVPHEALMAVCRRYPHLGETLWHDTLVDSAIFREWAMNVGGRRAPNRIGAFLLEMEARLTAIGACTDGEFELRLTQQELGNALGLSLVHLNKSLRKLREAGWVACTGRTYRLPDRDRLASAVGFSRSYLHLDDAPICNKSDPAFNPSARRV